MPAMISTDDLRDARDLLDLHQPGPAGFSCRGCGTAWPCSEVRYAWMVTGTPPDR